MKTTILLYLSCLLWIASGCNNFLDLKPDVKIATPETYADLRALLNHEGMINNSYIGLSEMGGDDYFLPQSSWESRLSFYQDVYLWKPNPVYLIGETNLYWTNPYRPIATANIVLETLVRNKLADTQRGKELRGEALFVRGFSFFNLMQLYIPAYEVNQGETILGIPIRLSSSINQVSTRASVQENYAQVIADLTMAMELLPQRTEFITHATVSTAQAALARVYLNMGNYEQALFYADAVLERKHKLTDFNTLKLTLLEPFPVKENVELLYFASSSGGSSLLSSSVAKVDTLLYASFADNDLRKKAFFTLNIDGYPIFKGFYSGFESTHFAGLALNELYLIKAECLMRLDKLQDGMNVLNELLKTRWKTGTYTAFQVTDKVSTLKILFAERRKELMRWGLRWMDLKRLNKEPDFAKTILRKLLINGKEESFELPPNDLRYVYLIPQDVINLTGMPQNKR